MATLHPLSPSTVAQLGYEYAGVDGSGLLTGLLYVVKPYAVEVRYVGDMTQAQYQAEVLYEQHLNHVNHAVNDCVHCDMEMKNGILWATID